MDRLFAICNFRNIICINSPNLSIYSPYELVFGRKPKLLLDLETDPDIKVSVTYKEYYERLEQKIEISTESYF